MQTLILTLHIIVCILLVILILLQSGKEGMGVIFGGGNSSVFGSTGAGGILAKLTTLMAIIFVITSLSYTYVTSTHTSSDSVILDVRIEEPPSPPATPQAVEQKAPDTASDQKAVTPPATEPAEPQSAAPEQKPATNAADTPAPAPAGSSGDTAPAEQNPATPK